MSDGGNQGPLLLANLKHLHHERDGIALFEPIGYGFFEDRRCKWPKRLAPLDLRVEDRLHVGATRVAQDRPVAKRPRSPFHASLKPADDLAVGNLRRRKPAQGNRAGPGCLNSFSASISGTS